jgi:acetyl-CoA carboxylase biotin carboxylase subunit
LPLPRRPAARPCIRVRFLAENPAFVEACADNELVFVGPPADVMAMMGDKIAAKQAMRRAEVPTVPGDDGATTLDKARGAAGELGYPILLKASAGGGGKGMRLVQGPDEIEDAFSTAASEAQAAFGVATLYVEGAGRRAMSRSRCSVTLRNVLTRRRECSIQRRHQKLIQESRRWRWTPRAARRWRPQQRVRAGRSGTETRARSSFCSAPTGASTSSS